MDTKAWGVIAAIAIIVAAAYWFMQPEQWPVRNDPPQRHVIVLFGDEYALGSGSSNPATRGTGPLLENRVGRPVVVMGRADDTTSMGLDRLASVLALRPGMVVVSLGMADFRRKLPREGSFENLRRLVERLHEAGALVVLVGTEPDAMGYSYKADFRQLARSTGSLLVPDALRGILTNNDLRSTPQLPNDRGYEVFAERIGDVIEPAVRRMPPVPGAPTTLAP